MLKAKSKMSLRAVVVITIFVVTTSISMTSTEVKAQTTSGTDWASICNTISFALVSSCDTYVNGDRTLTTEGERAYGCIRNGVLMAGGALAIGVPTPIIIGGLRVLAGQTGCDNIINWDLVSRSDLQSLQNLIPKK